MPSTRETILVALHARLQSLVDSATRAQTWSDGFKCALGEATRILDQILSAIIATVPSRAVRSPAVLVPTRASPGRKASTGIHPPAGCRKPSHTQAPSLSARLAQVPLSSHFVGLSWRTRCVCRAMTAAAQNISSAIGCQRSGIGSIRGRTPMPRSPKLKQA